MHFISQGPLMAHYCTRTIVTTKSAFIKHELFSFYSINLSHLNNELEQLPQQAPVANQQRERKTSVFVAVT